MRRIILIACWLLASVTSGSAQARPYSVDDLLKLESYGGVLISDAERLVLVERRRPYEEAPDFGYGAAFNGRVLTRILATSVDRPGPLRPLFAQERSAGYWLAGLSPSGRRLAVYRLRARVLSLGVVDLATRSVRWLSDGPDTPTTSPNPIWLGEHRLAFIAMTGRRLPFSMLIGAGFRHDVDRLYRRQAAGAYSGTSVSSRSGPDPDATVRRLVSVSIRGGVERELFRGDIVDAAPSPDGTTIAVMTAGMPVPPPTTAISVSFDARRHAITLVRTADGLKVAVPGDAMRGFMSWSKSGLLLALLRRSGSDWSDGFYATVDDRGRSTALGGQNARAAVSEEGGGRLSYAGWAGSTPVASIRTPGGRPFWARLLKDRFEPVDVPSGARPAGPVTDGIRLRDGGKLLSVTASGVRTVADGVYQTGPTTLEPFNDGFREDMNPVTARLVARNVDGHAIVTVGDDGAVANVIVTSSDAVVLAAGAGALVTTSSDVRDHRVLWLDRPGGRRVFLDGINERVRDVDLPRAVPLTSAGPGSTRLVHWLLMPSDRGVRPPLVVVPYPGLVFTKEVPRQNAISRYDLSTNALLLSAAGYAVLLPSMPPDPSGGNPTPRIVAQVETAVDAAVASGEIDGSRVGILGHSFGGYTALTLATGSDRFSAVIASNGLSDLAAMHGAMSGADKLRLEYGVPFASSAGWTESGQGGMRVTPAMDAQAYVAASPAYRMDRLRIPLLLFAGDVDPVDMAQSERAFMEAARNGADVTLVRFWGESHEVSSPGNVREHWRMIRAFLDRHLRSNVRLPPPDVDPPESLGRN